MDNIHNARSSCQIYAFNILYIYTVGREVLGKKKKKTFNQELYKHENFYPFLQNPASAITHYCSKLYNIYIRIGAVGNF